MDNVRKGCSRCSLLRVCSSFPTLAEKCLLNDKYHYIRTLGKGNFGEVKLAHDIMTSHEVAVKVIDQTHVFGSSKICDEVNILRIIDHPNIVKLYNNFHSETKVYIIMEFVNGGDLNDYLYQHAPLEEKPAQSLFKQIASAMFYLHEAGIVHRDLKPENILLDTIGTVKISDFGLSTTFFDGQKFESFCGTMQYAAPEIFQHVPYEGPKCDVWSMGTILYKMLTRCLPFSVLELKRIANHAMNGEYEVPANVSTACQELLKNMLSISCDERWTLANIAKARWISEAYTSEDILQTPGVPATNPDLNDKPSCGISGRSAADSFNLASVYTVAFWDAPALLHCMKRCTSVDAEMLRRDSVVEGKTGTAVSCPQLFFTTEPSKPSLSLPNPSGVEPPEPPSSAPASYSSYLPTPSGLESWEIVRPAPSLYSFSPSTEHLEESSLVHPFYCSSMPSTTGPESSKTSSPTPALGVIAESDRNVSQDHKKEKGRTRWGRIWRSMKKYCCCRCRRSEN